MIKEMIRVFIADDHLIVREGIRNVLESNGGYTVVGEAESCAELEETMSSLNPDVVLLDMQLKDGSSLHHISQIRSMVPESYIVILSVDSSISAIHQSFERGAHGYVTKSSGSRRLLEAIDSVLRGELYSDGVVSEVLLKNVRLPNSANSPNADHAYGSLSNREQQVLHMMARGSATKEIAAELKVSPKTVESHRLSLYRKLGVSDPIELIRYAAQIGIIDPSSWIQTDSGTSTSMESMS